MRETGRGVSAGRLTQGIAQFCLAFPTHRGGAVVRWPRPTKWSETICANPVVWMGVLSPSAEFTLSGAEGLRPPIQTTGLAQIVSFVGRGQRAPPRCVGNARQNWAIP